MKKKLETCSICKYWLRMKEHSPHGGPAMFGDKTGQCRSHSPKSNDGELSYFPMTFESEWCGEFKEAEKCE